MKQKKKTNVGNVLRIIAIVICILVIIGCCGYLLNYWLQNQKNAKLLEDTAETYIIPEDEEEQRVVTIVPTVNNQETDDVQEIDDPDADVQEEDADAPEADEPDTEEEAPSVYTLSISNIDFQSLQAQSENVCAWIQVSGLSNINMPVVWSGEDTFYLTHAWDGSYTTHGAVFMEALNDRSFSDAYTLVYGHNMKDGSMFGTLKRYAEASFYKKYGGLITIYLPDEVRIYQIFSARYVMPDDETTFTVGFMHDSIFGDYLAEMARSSLYNTGITVNQDDQVITLSTCAYSGTQRFVVHAKLIQTLD